MTVAAAAAIAAATVAATSVPTIEILPSKQFYAKVNSVNPASLGSSCKTTDKFKNPSLFHPSKINMSSTPIKSTEHRVKPNRKP